MLSKIKELFQESKTEIIEKNNKDLTDFLLEEYKNIAQAYFNSHEVTAKWVKFYFIIIATPFSVILFVYKNSSPLDFNFNNLPNIISTYFLLVGFIGMLLSFIVLNSRLDSTLYARSVNGVRKYFKDVHKSKNTDDNIDQYFVLPDNVNLPSFMKLGDLSILVALMSLLDSFYISLGLPQISSVKYLYIGCISQTNISFFVFFTVLCSHWMYYYYVTNKKTKTYNKQK